MKPEATHPEPHRATPEVATASACCADGRAAASGIGYRPGLHRFAWALVATTFVLVIAGGTVTSRGVGLAVPDWPNSFGYNMFLFPPSMWRGGIFWEHAHRLLGSVVGML